jgi:hypothetical protein
MYRLVATSELPIDGFASQAHTRRIWLPVYSETSGDPTASFNAKFAQVPIFQLPAKHLQTSISEMLAQRNPVWAKISNSIHPDGVQTPKFLLPPSTATFAPGSELLAVESATYHRTGPQCSVSDRDLLPTSETLNKQGEAGRPSNVINFFRVRLVRQNWMKHWPLGTG